LNLRIKSLEAQQLEVVSADCAFLLLRGDRCADRRGFWQTGLAFSQSPFEHRDHLVRLSGCFAAEVDDRDCGYLVFTAGGKQFWGHHPATVDLRRFDRHVNTVLVALWDLRLWLQHLTVNFECKVLNFWRPLSIERLGKTACLGEEFIVLHEVLAPVVQGLPALAHSLARPFDVDNLFNNQGLAELVLFKFATGRF
jgi:hypothetical protein